MNTLTTNYLDKLAELKAICEDYTTSVATLDTKIDELTDIESDINTEMGTGLISDITTLAQLDRVILCRQEMMTQALRHCYVLCLIKLKQDEYVTMVGLGATAEELATFETETLAIKTYMRENILTLIPVEGLKCRVSSVSNAF